MILCHSAPNRSIFLKFGAGSFKVWEIDVFVVFWILNVFDSNYLRYASCLVAGSRIGS